VDDWDLDVRRVEPGPGAGHKSPVTVNALTLSVRIVFDPKRSRDGLKPDT